MAEIKLSVARELIKEKRYDDARIILEEVDHPKAREWLSKLDKISPKNYSRDTEHVIYKDMRIKITNKRIITARQTIPVGQIAFVEETATSPSRSNLIFGLFFSLVGVFMCYGLSVGNTYDSTNMFLFAVLPLGLGCYAFYEYFRVKRRYYVSIGVSSGAIKILSSKDEEYIEKIIDNINHALVNP